MMSTLTHLSDTKPSIIHGDDDDLYQYTVYVGEHDITLNKGDSAWFYTKQSATNEHKEAIFGLSNRVRNLSKDATRIIHSSYCCTVIRGYNSPGRCVEIVGTNLPYINGCSSETILPAIRLGDPTMQLLYMPEGSSEQEEHIHSTVRVVYVLKGSATCYYGMGQQTKQQKISKGSVLILPKMLPHHFVTDTEPLLCSPLHVWSSVGPSEKNHPMFNGTHLL